MATSARSLAGGLPAMASRAHIRARSVLAVLALTAFVLPGMAGLAAPAAHAATPQAVVTLTFDDGDVDQYLNAFPVLQQYGMHATFYIVTGFIGVNPNNMTLSQLQSLASAGNEIAGHTVLHPNLTQLSTDEATREICQGRNTLLSWGFPATDFAYPYAAYNSATEGIAAQCGYNSAREDGDLKSPYGCFNCIPAETIPPADPYSVRAPGAVTTQWSLADLESLVTQTESAGGWMPIVFHNVCDNACEPYSVTPATFSAFIAWLAGQNVPVQTVSQVIGGAVSPPVSPPVAAPAAPGTNGTVNPSLETANPYNPAVPACWTTSRSGTNSGTFAETSGAHSGSVAETVTTSSYTSGQARLITTQDLGQCAPGAVPGDPYRVSAWYQSTVPAQFVLWYRDQNGGWHYWTQSPQFAAAGGWTQASWDTPAVPSGATGLSYGMQIGAVGTLTTDDYSLVDTAPAKPVVSLTAPAAGATLTGPVTFSANASSAAGIARVDFLVNGVVEATATSAPYTASWNSAAVGDGPVTITARATDTAGNQATTPGTAATISNAASRGGNMLANASVETVTGTGTTPDCWQEAGYGTNTYAWSRTAGHTGKWAQKVTISSYTSGDRKLVTAQNPGPCSPRITPGSAYKLGAWYKSTRQTHIVAYYLNASGAWVYWAKSGAFAAKSSWAHAAWVTPAVPSGALAVSFGLDIAATGSLSTDDYSMAAS